MLFVQVNPEDGKELFFEPTAGAELAGKVRSDHPRSRFDAIFMKNPDITLEIRFYD